MRNTMYGWLHGVPLFWGKYHSGGRAWCIYRLPDCPAGLRLKAPFGAHSPSTSYVGFWLTC